MKEEEDELEDGECSSGADNVPSPTESPKFDYLNKSSAVSNNPYPHQRLKHNYLFIGSFFTQYLAQKKLKKILNNLNEVKTQHHLLHNDARKCYAT